MSSLAKTIYDLDKSIFHRFRDLFGDTFVDDWTVISGIWVFWVPLLVFLAVLIYSSRKELRFLNLFFLFATFVLAYQSASILSMIFMQPAPFVVENILFGHQLPAFTPDYHIFSLPDWTTAAFAASIHFARLRLRGSNTPLPTWVMFVFPILTLSRIIPGYAYPMDVLAGVLLGSLIGFFMHQFARSVEIVLKNPS